MEPASCTPEGEPNTCHVCGASVFLDPSRPPGDATCSRCGVLIWFHDSQPSEADYLAARGAYAEADDAGQVIKIRFVGSAYNDASVIRLSKITGLQAMDIRETSISKAAADYLQSLMPETTIISVD